MFQPKIRITHLRGDQPLAVGEDLKFVNLRPGDVLELGQRAIPSCYSEACNRAMGSYVLYDPVWETRIALGWRDSPDDGPERLLRVIGCNDPKTPVRSMGAAVIIGELGPESGAASPADSKQAFKGTESAVPPFEGSPLPRRASEGSKAKQVRSPLLLPAPRK